MLILDLFFGRGGVEQTGKPPAEMNSISPSCPKWIFFDS